MMSQPNAQNSKKPLDWAAALARLAWMQDSLDRAENPSPEALERTYNERAKRLAKANDSADSLQETEMLLVFRLGEEKYAFPVSEITEILRQSKLAPVPGAPPFVAGVIQVRSEIRTVCNLQHRLGIAQTTSDAGGDVILLRGGRSPFGVRVDGVEEIRRVMKDDRRLAGHSSHVAWMTDDLVRVLNTETLGEMES
jgi:chemotaxis signal transduction protein